MHCWWPGGTLRWYFIVCLTDGILFKPAASEDKSNGQCRVAITWLINSTLLHMTDTIYDSTHLLNDAERQHGLPSPERQWPTLNLTPRDRNGVQTLCPPLDDTPCKMCHDSSCHWDEKRVTDHRHWQQEASSIRDARIEEKQLFLVCFLFFC